MNKYIYIALFLLLIPLLNASPWSSTLISCNNYRYFETSSAAENVIFYYSNGTTAYTFVGGSQIFTGIMTNNIGHMWIWNDYSDSWADTGTNLDMTKSYTVRFSGSGEWYSDLTTFPVYSNCTIPTITVSTSYPSTIMADRYRLNFTINNNGSYSGINCTLNLIGISSSYNTSFYNSIVIDLLYSSYPRQYTTAHLVCTYINGYGTTTQFDNRVWAVDYAMAYKIADWNRKIGQVSINPNILYEYDYLKSINFLVVDSEYKVDYGKSITAHLTTNINTTSVGCDSFSNITIVLTPPAYSIPVSIKCTNNTSIPMTLTVNDVFDNDNLDGLTFNVTWSQGVMVIDNVNLIKSAFTDDMELWATVSSDYYKNPLPTDTNLTCTYSLTSYDTSELFSGTMELYYTYDSYGDLVQVDARNKTIDIDTSYNRSDKFAFQLNCSANGYANQTTQGDRWIGVTRLKTFTCKVVQGIYYSTARNSISFSDPYMTDNAFIQCILSPDLDFPSGATEIQKTCITNIVSAFNNNWYLSYPSISVYPNGNIGAGFYTGCADSISSTASKATKDSSGVYYTIPYSSTFHKKDSMCNMQLLTVGKERLFAVFSMLNNSASQLTSSCVTPTSASTYFDLIYRPQYSHSSTTFIIVNNKTINKNIVLDGDVLKCETLYEDPSVDVTDVVHEIIDSNGRVVCSVSPDTLRNIYNDTWMLDSVVFVDNSSCPIFMRNNTNGTLQCKASIYKYNSEVDVYYSGLLIYNTNPTGLPPTPPITDLVLDIIKTPLSAVGNFAVANPIEFMIGGFILIVTERTWSGMLLVIWRKIVGEKHEEHK